ncbi:MAG: helix-turn-helix domain-containing protein [Candidatus Scalindua sp.]
MEKNDARKLSTEAQQQIRNQSIQLRKSRKTYKEISEITCVHNNTIARWCKAYQRKGAKAIQIKKRGRRTVGEYLKRGRGLRLKSHYVKLTSSILKPLRIKAK